MAVDRTRLNPIDDRPVNDIELSEQEILNKSFDRDYNVLANEILVLGADNRLKRQGVIATEAALRALLDSANILREAIYLIHNPPYIDKANNAIRNVPAGGSIATITTLTTLANFGTQPADVTYRINSNNAWANTVRRTIT